AAAQQRYLFAQADHAHAGIDQQVAIAAAHMPDVAAVVVLDMRLVDPGDAVADGAALVPGFGCRDLHALARLRSTWRSASALAKPPKRRRTCFCSCFFSSAIGIASRATNTMKRLLTASNKTSPAVRASTRLSIWPRSCSIAMRSPT